MSTAATPVFTTTGYICTRCGQSACYGYYHSCTPALPNAVSFVLTPAHDREFLDTLRDIRKLLEELTKK